MISRRDQLRASWWLDGLGFGELDATIVRMIPNDEVAAWMARRYPGGPGVDYNPTPERYEAMLKAMGIDPKKETGPDDQSSAA